MITCAQNYGSARGREKRKGRSVPRTPLPYRDSHTIDIIARNRKRWQKTQTNSIHQQENKRQQRITVILIVNAAYSR